MSAPTITPEGGGYVLTCECDWTRFYATRTDATAGQVEHAKKCKGPKRPKEQAAPKPRARASWDDREGSTWIDQL